VRPPTHSIARFTGSLCLTEKALRRMTMFGFLVDATETVKRTLKRVQLKFLGQKNKSSFMPN